eukprot:g2711.t1
MGKRAGQTCDDGPDQRKRARAHGRAPLMAGETNGGGSSIPRSSAGPAARDRSANARIAASHSGDSSSGKADRVAGASKGDPATRATAAAPAISSNTRRNSSSGKHSCTSGAPGSSVSTSRHSDPAELLVFPEGVELKVGTRVEVQWDVEQPDEDVGSVAIWWGATYMGRSADGKTKGTAKQHAVHLLMYDARAGYEECESEVVFMSMSRLLDVAEKDTLMWRYEGQEWVCDPQGENIGPFLDQPSSGLIMTMPDLLLDQRRLEHNEHGGVSVQALGMAALGRLPYLAQTNLASNFRTFADSIKERLAEIRRVRGSGATVTSEDIRAIMESIESAAA